MDLVWYTGNPVGKTTLGLTVKKLCESAGIEGHYTNHSLRATTATRGLAKGIPEKFVMERTGHRDVRSLQKYQRPEVLTKVEISKAFDCTATMDVGKESHVSKEAKQGSMKRVIESDEEIVEKRLCENRAKSGEDKSVAFHNCSFMIKGCLNVD